MPSEAYAYALVYDPSGAVLMGKRNVVRTRYERQTLSEPMKDPGQYTVPGGKVAAENRPSYRYSYGSAWVRAEARFFARYAIEELEREATISRFAAPRRVSVLRFTIMEGNEHNLEINYALLEVASVRRYAMAMAHTCCNKPIHAFGLAFGAVTFKVCRCAVDDELRSLVVMPLSEAYNQLMIRQPMTQSEHSSWNRAADRPFNSSGVYTAPKSYFWRARHNSQNRPSGAGWHQFALERLRDDMLAPHDPRGGFSYPIPAFLRQRARRVDPSMNKIDRSSVAVVRLDND